MIASKFLEMSGDEPFHDIKKLYFMHCFFAFASRMWEIGIVLLVSIITNNSLFVVALAGLFSSGSVFLFSADIGKYFDKNDRMFCMKIALIVKTAAVSAGYLLCALILQTTPSGERLIDEVHLIYVIPIMCAVASLSFSMVIMSIEKDWIVVLANNNSDWLSTTNSTMTQIDLACNALGPVVTGILFSVLSPQGVAVVLLFINAISVLCLYLFLNNVYHSWHKLTYKGEVVTSAPSTAHTATSSTPLANQVKNHKVNYSSTANTVSVHKSHLVSDVTFWNCGCTGSMIAYSMLYLTVLSYGSLMLVYLMSAGMSYRWLGITRGLAAISGFLGR